MTAAFLHLAYGVLIQGYALTATPWLEQLRDRYLLPQFLMPMVVNMISSSLIAGLTVWIAMHRWLARHNTAAVDEPRKLYGTFIALLLLFTLAASAGSAILQNKMMDYVLSHRMSVSAWLGASGIHHMLALSLLLKALNIVVDILGAWVVVRIAAWTVQPSGPAVRPVYVQRHAAWIAGLTVLAWQLNVSIALGGYLQLQTLSAGWLQYVLGYLVLPAVVLALSALVCLKILPRQIGTAGSGRAVAHGTITFWVAQALGIGLGVLAIRSMTWSQLGRAVESNMAAAVTLLIYGALLALGCAIGRWALYRNRVDE
ncbi:hypothetical protein RAS12_15080 [Achromobacter seleniivolatilans]|uniref:Uncharacterized protein n=1 Tax=Achromobacter seleniivolatilans TaxID=3047478 RepID=A0ABY9LU78_9BURK|nr:hypothetical protein [Achromobacter sp. R39]WMD17980.1 hypothetical protein RAS12_15080 [Achromobacter sp. R39]